MSPAQLKLLPPTIDQAVPNGGTTGFEGWARRAGLDITVVGAVHVVR